MMKKLKQKSSTCFDGKGMMGVDHEGERLSFVTDETNDDGDDWSYSSPKDNQHHRPPVRMLINATPRRRLNDNNNKTTSDKFRALFTGGDNNNNDNTNKKTNTKNGGGNHLPLSLFLNKDDGNEENPVNELRSLEEALFTFSQDPPPRVARSTPKGIFIDNYHQTTSAMDHCLYRSETYDDMLRDSLNACHTLQQNLDDLITTLLTNTNNNKNNNNKSQSHDNLLLPQQNDRKNENTIQIKTKTGPALSKTIGDLASFPPPSPLTPSSGDFYSYDRGGDRQIPPTKPVYHPPLSPVVQIQRFNGQIRSPTFLQKLVSPVEPADPAENGKNDSGKNSSRSNAAVVIEKVEKVAGSDTTPVVAEVKDNLLTAYPPPSSPSPNSLLANEEQAFRKASPTNTLEETSSTNSSENTVLEVSSPPRSLSKSPVPPPSPPALLQPPPRIKSSPVVILDYDKPGTTVVLVGRSLTTPPKQKPFHQNQPGCIVSSGMEKRPPKKGKKPEFESDGIRIVAAGNDAANEVNKSNEPLPRERVSLRRTSNRPSNPSLSPIVPETKPHPAVVMDKHGSNNEEGEKEVEYTEVVRKRGPMVRLAEEESTEIGGTIERRQPPPTVALRKSITVQKTPHGKYFPQVTTAPSDINNKRASQPPLLDSASPLPVPPEAALTKFSWNNRYSYEFSNRYGHNTQQQQLQQQQELVRDHFSDSMSQYEEDDIRRPHGEERRMPPSNHQQQQKVIPTDPMPGPAAVVEEPLYSQRNHNNQQQQQAPPRRKNQQKLQVVPIPTSSHREIPSDPAIVPPPRRLKSSDIYHHSNTNRPNSSSSMTPAFPLSSSTGDQVDEIGITSDVPRLSSSRMTSTTSARSSQEAGTTTPDEHSSAAAQIHSDSNNGNNKPTKVEEDGRQQSRKTNKPTESAEPKLLVSHVLADQTPPTSAKSRGNKRKVIRML